MTAVLSTAGDDDVTALMQWLPDAAATRQWAGPGFRYPFDARTFREDLRLSTVPSYALRDADAALLGFGQVYERWGRMNLARLIVAPDRRGAGIGRQLVQCLMQEAQRSLALPEFSLFVYRENNAAGRLYRGLGFRPAALPEPSPELADCDYLVRPSA